MLGGQKFASYAEVRVMIDYWWAK